LLVLFDGVLLLDYQASYWCQRSFFRLSPFSTQNSEMTIVMVFALSFVRLIGW
jgi:hypothetical protein